MALVSLALAALLSAQAPEKVDYARDIQPLLRANCYSCHGPTLQNGGLRLDRRRDPMPNRVGANGARIVPGNSATSRVYLRVAGNQAGTQMPPTGALTSAEISLIKTWIDQGAEWPDEFAGDTPSRPQNPQAVQLMDTLRRGDRGSFEKLLAASPTAGRSKGSGGTSPLMYAALYGDANSVRLLLDKGADPNMRNDAGATALMWAVDDPKKTRVLLERGADANARSDDGRTPLLLATARSGASEVVTQLLDHGAKLEGQPVVSRAAATGDEALMRLLIRRGAELKPLPDDLAMRSGCAGCIELLLASAERADLNRALTQAARYGNSAGIRMLLDRGAEPTGVILGTAAASEKIPLEGITALLDRGARSETAINLALRLGETPVVDALRKAGGKETPAPGPNLKRPTAPPPLRVAVERSLPLLQHADVVFLKKGGCVSCHNNSLFLMTVNTARKQGFRVDEPSVQAQLKDTAVYLESWRERYLQDIPIPGGVDTTSYILTGLAAVNYPPDPATDAMARFVMRRQAADGGWRIATQRPPIESSDIEATALALRSLQVYAPKPQKAEYTKAIQRGVNWLTKAESKTTEDHVFQLLGLTWASPNKNLIRETARELLALQKPDGGWSQVPTLASDAYATGQALTALAESGILAVSEPPYQRGVQFLLNTQLEDGSWYVRTRANPVQPPFDSEFPHGADQFISAAATNWATIALAHAAR
ncbi:MAG TPA: ankyrin repeat domain-containing protein [Chthoniobacteraceae bacterium]|nr:ankyrin repeat domain-containing protein [Chthoniobacteraceae bacterium]